MVASLVNLDGFHLLLSTQLTADLTLEWSGGSMFHPLSHIYAKTIFIALKPLQKMFWINALLFLINCEQMQDPFWTQLSHWQMFIQNGEYTAFWYFQFLCYLMQFQFTIGQNEFEEFFGVFRDNCLIWVIWAFSIICVCTTPFKVSILPLNHFSKQHLSSHCFAWIVFVPIRKQWFINTQNSDLSIVLKICNSSFT